MEILANDVRYAFRIMRKNPGFTLIIILTLALGIGANTSIFSIVNAVLLRSLPFYDPGRLVMITFNNPGIGLRNVPYSVPELEDLKSRAGVFEEVSVVVSGSTNLTGARQQPERLELLSYGLLVYMVGQRSREIGIRVALGAQRSDILTLILGKGLLLVGVGIAIGLVLASAAAPMIATLLYGVHPFDVPVFATLPLVLMFVAFLATYIPARRATMVDPIIALHES